MVRLSFKKLVVSHRSTVRKLIPRIAQAALFLAPSATACSISDNTYFLIFTDINRPRLPPISVTLFF